VKALFLTKLCEALDLDRPDWRETSVMLMDNAPYNVKDECIAHIRRLNIPMVFNAPYSFDASPVELFFSYFKHGTIVDPNVPTGKL
jgi:transposase